VVDDQGHPAFVPVPRGDFKRIHLLLGGDKTHSTGVPQADVETDILRAILMIRTWREHIGITPRGHGDRINLRYPEKPRSTQRQISDPRRAEAVYQEVIFEVTQKQV
jgi:hypothetical protein